VPITGQVFLSGHIFASSKGVKIDQKFGQFLTALLLVKNLARSNLA